MTEGTSGVKSSIVSRLLQARTLTLFFFATTVILASIVLLNGTRSLTAEQAKYSYIDISRHLIAQEHFLVNIQPLREEVNRLADTFESAGGQVSIYIEFLNTGANISINQSTYIWPASLSKVPLALAVMKKIELGEWRLDDELALTSADFKGKQGLSVRPVASAAVGTKFTVETLLKEMLIHSDNTAFYILSRSIDAPSLDRIVYDLGLEALFTDQGRISSKEYSRLLRSLYTASFLSRSYSQQVLAWLDESPFEDFAAGPIPDEVRFPHKYGEHDTQRVFADSGIVYAPHRPYIISVMVQGVPERPLADERGRAAAFIQQVSKITYEYFSAPK